MNGPFADDVPAVEEPVDEVVELPEDEVPPDDVVDVSAGAGAGDGVVLPVAVEVPLESVAVLSVGVGAAWTGPRGWRRLFPASRKEELSAEDTEESAHHL